MVRYQVQLCDRVIFAPPAQQILSFDAIAENVNVLGEIYNSLSLVFNG